MAASTRLSFTKTTTRGNGSIAGREEARCRHTYSFEAKAGVRPLRGSARPEGQMTKARGFGRWHPSPEQISIALDCVVARVPITRAAELIGIKPRTLWVFARRINLPVFKAWRDRPRYVRGCSSAEAATMAETSAPVHDSHPAPEAATCP
jgi:hypothetical protein